MTTSVVQKVPRCRATGPRSPHSGPAWLPHLGNRLGRRLRTPGRHQEQRGEESCPASGHCGSPPLPRSLAPDQRHPTVDGRLRGWWRAPPAAASASVRARSARGTSIRLRCRRGRRLTASRQPLGAPPQPTIAVVVPAPSSARSGSIAIGAMIQGSAAPPSAPQTAALGNDRLARPRCRSATASTPAAITRPGTRPARVSMPPRAALPPDPRWPGRSRSRPRR